MKTSVTPVCVHPFKTYILTLLLAGGLSACSSAPDKEDVYVEPEPQTGTIVEAEPMQAEAEPKSLATRVKVNHPRQYIVQKGDTLWDIASLFLKDPWFWPEIWYQNPQVANPHLIFPGDILTLIYVDGEPRIVVDKPGQGQVVTRQPSGAAPVVSDGAGPLPVVRLSPSIRTESIEASIDTIPGDAIRQFLNKPRVITKDELKAAPYILGSDDDHLILGQGNSVYIRGEIDKERVRYTVVREGEKLVDPDTKDVLGYEAIYAGEVLISSYGDPAFGELTFTEREVLYGDRLLPTDKSKVDNIYFPRLPDRDISGRIIHLPDALFGIAKLQVAVVNRGSRDGLESGNLLAIYTKGRTVHDHYNRGKKVQLDLPDVRSGVMMIFRTFDSVSYGLVLESTRVIHENDFVRTPR